MKYQQSQTKHAGIEEDIAQYSEKIVTSLLELRRILASCVPSVMAVLIFLNAATTESGTACPDGRETIKVSNWY